MEGHLTLTEEEFEAAIGDALDQIPTQLLDAMDNVVIIAAREPDPEDATELLGLYEGVPLAERGGGMDGMLPDCIRIFQGPLERACSTREELIDEIAVTVVHEIGHHFGIEEDRLHELGWG
ncbi:metallopeptidase family protein [Ornithinimicrobium sp. INDO-MA30-4]|uniref:metallopeptidase family protein n=1 Tax=Ornithinimicrobium sp. INDO-MA30-4 TaxID=2908651 RepID=UPI001F40779A|nr:metallopeptidase family protein [Ornithinimicrobium sp. INDO-MA30-4]UJH71313.1 metallopeptidase family protein [Ornithinimicrobium sp. INDO-MA30-4]